MTETPAARPARTFAEVEDALLSRWPETKLEPTLDRIRAFTEVLGDPQRGYPVVHLTGTNGKTTTSRLVDALLSEIGLRTGRYTSPHLQSATEQNNTHPRPTTRGGYVGVPPAFGPCAALGAARHEVP